MKKFALSVVGFLVVMVVFSVVVMADNSIKEGNWEVTGNWEMTKAADGPVTKGTVTGTECVTNANPIPEIKQILQNLPGCNEPQIQINGGTVDYTLSCPTQAGVIDMKGHFVYTGDALVGNSTQHSVLHGKESNMKTNSTGKYIGPC